MGNISKENLNLQPQLKLSTEQESLLKKHLIYLAKIGQGGSKKDIPMIVKEILDTAEKEQPDI